MTQRLIDQMAACGPTIDRAAAERSLAVLASAARVEGWIDLLEAARPLLAPILAASPYLAALARRDPARLKRLLLCDPGAAILDLVVRTHALASHGLEQGKIGLRHLKAEAHLVIALADLGGVWDLEAVTGALSQFADAAVAVSLDLLARAEHAAGRIKRLGTGPEGPVPGWFCIAMGKHGAFELNYSSDIDLSIFYEPSALCLADGIEPQTYVTGLTQRFAAMLQDRTGDGYVFRVDLRLRPDPSSTPVAIPVAAALDYYETAGQNWERAAFIKARACAGDLPRAEAFLRDLTPFIWRRSLDFAAIADIQSIKRQIHIHKVDDRLTASGSDLKLGRGGIREVEFFVQTQQLILGGRHPGLRSRSTLDALRVLTKAGHVSSVAARDLEQGYRALRAWEHLVQMVSDEQTHRLPEDATDRRRVAALAGYLTLARFDRVVERTLVRVNRRYGELFPGEEPLSSRFGSLIFTGVEDDAETLRTLKAMGFSRPAGIAQAIRHWHHGRLMVARTERGRELLTRLVPRLLDLAHDTGAPDLAFARFSDFLGQLRSGTQALNLLLAQPRLFELIVRVLTFAPRLAASLGRRPATLDALLDPHFFQPFDKVESDLALAMALADASGFEAQLDAVRQVHREQAFRIGVQVISGVATARTASQAFADLAERCIGGLAPLALGEIERLAGTYPGQVAVIALGKCGSREMNAGSDLDLMTVYVADAGDGHSSLKGWPAETYFGRFTQRLIAALSIPTAEGSLYAVDMRLRPSGTQGPVAVSLSAFEAYYRSEAETWEAMALTRARVVWSSTPATADLVNQAIAAALQRPRSDQAVRRDASAMRALMAQEQPATSHWDLKRTPGGLVDIEFAAQVLQLVHARSGGTTHSNTFEALAAVQASGELDSATGEYLREAWSFQHDLVQVLKIAHPDGVDPGGEPAAFRRLLAKAVAAPSYRSLVARLRRHQTLAHRAFEQIASEGSDGAC